MAAKPRVLLVDDEEDLVWSLRARLRRALPEFQIDGTTDAAYALARIDDVAVVVTDLKMPGKSGLDLIVEARATGAAARFVVMTAFPRDGARGKVELASIGYLEKPFELESMVFVIQAAARTPTSRGIAAAAAAEIVVIAMLANATGALRFGSRGVLHFDRGEPIHALAGTLAGEAALDALLGDAAAPLSFVTEALPDKSLGAESKTLSSIRRAARRIEEARTTKEQEYDMANMMVQTTLEKLRAIDGYVGSALVDSDSGMALGIDGGGANLNLEVAAAGNTEVVRAKRKTVKALAMNDDIEDILISLGKQYHLIRPLRGRPTVFIYVAIERARANLAMARMTLSDAEKNLQL